MKKTADSSSGNPMHFSVGALIRRSGRYLLIDRAQPPFGFAGIAGHIEEGEEPEQALMREVLEESGLVVVRQKLIHEEEVDGNWCKDGTQVHYWYVFECAVSGKIKKNPLETKSIRWYTQRQIKRMNLEPVWAYWFKKLHNI